MTNDETVEHVVVEHQGEPEEAGAVETVVAAETAVALAGATAAAAELDAAERMRRLETESQEWRETQATSALELRHSLTRLREEELPALNASLAANLQAVAERQEALEQRFQLLTQAELAEAEALEEVAAAVETTPSEDQPDLGTAAEVEAGPVSLGGSLGADVGKNSPRPNAVRRRRWI